MLVRRINCKICATFILFMPGFISVMAGGPVWVRGRLLDEERNPVPFATVALSLPGNMSGIVKGAVSGVDGVFALQGEQGKAYNLKISFVGYKEHTKRIQLDSVALDLGEIIMKKTSYKMREVVVKPELEVKADKIVYNFENDPDRARSSVFDMLGRMPMIEIDPMGKIIVGSRDKKYIVLRKGREDALFDFRHVTFEDMIKRLPAMGFTTFEIWTVVPPKYKDYDYVINILPDPNQRLFGATGSPSVNYQGRTGTIDGGLGGNGSANIVRLSGGVNYSHRDAPKTKSETTTLFYGQESAADTTYKEKETMKHVSDVWKVDLSASVDITKKQFVTFKGGASFNDGEMKRMMDGERQFVGSSGENMLSRYVNKNHADAWNAGIVYELTLGSARTLNLSYLYNSAPSDEDNVHYKESDWNDEVKEKVTEQETNRSHRWQVDYYDRFFDNRMTLTARVGYLKMDFKNESRTEDELTGREDMGAYTCFEQDFHRIDGWLNVGYNIGKKLNLTFRVEADYLPDCNVTRFVQGTQEEFVSQKKLLFTPTGDLTWQFSIPKPSEKNQKSFNEMTPQEQIAYAIKCAEMGIPATEIQSGVSIPNSRLWLSYGFWQRRPGVTQLTNFIDEQNPLYIKQGNPGLRPEGRHSFYARFGSWFINSLVANFSFSNNKIVSQNKREDGMIINTYDNVGRNRNWGVGASHSFFKSKFFVNAGVSGSRTDYGNDIWSKWIEVHAGLKYSQILRPGLSLSASTNYRDCFNRGAVGNEDLFPVDLSLELLWAPKLFGNDAFFVLSANDLLDFKRRSRSYDERPDFYRERDMNNRQIPIYLSFRVTFGKFKVKPVRSAKTEIEIRGFSTDPEE